MQKMRTIKAEVFRCQCEYCGHEFKMPGFADSVQDRRLLLTEDGCQAVYLDCEHDAVFNEVHAIVADLLEGCGYSRLWREHLFGEVFAATCDPLDGKRIEALNDYVCPHCGSNKVYHWGYWMPRYERVRLPVVTHEAWLARDEVQQGKRIMAALMKAVEQEPCWRHN